MIAELIGAGDDDDIGVGAYQFGRRAPRDHVRSGERCDEAIDIGNVARVPAKRFGERRGTGGRDRPGATELADRQVRQDRDTTHRLGDDHRSSFEVAEWGARIPQAILAYDAVQVL